MNTYVVICKRPARAEGRYIVKAPNIFKATQIAGDYLTKKFEIDPKEVCMTDIGYATEIPQEI